MSEHSVLASIDVDSRGDTGANPVSHTKGKKKRKNYSRAAGPDTLPCSGCKTNVLRIEFALDPKTGEIQKNCITCNIRNRARHKHKREMHPGYAIAQDAKKHDKAQGFAGNDLNEEFVIWFLSTSCIYCGDTQNAMTVDRIDTKRPHNQDNVNPSCIRCNHIRNDMPYWVWITFFVPLVRFLFQRGFFKGWRDKKPHQFHPLRVSSSAAERGPVKPLVRRFESFLTLLFPAKERLC
jgi:hypothetical protein